MVVDLETTGGSAQTEAITEIGAVKVRGGEVLGEFATLVDPGRSIPPQITMLTGITDSMVLQRPAHRRGAARLPGVHPRHRAGRAQRRRSTSGFLKAACRRLDLPWPRPAVVDTVQLARRVLTREEAPSVRLVRAGPAAGRAGGARPPGAHRRQGHRRRAARAVRAARVAGRAQPGRAAGRGQGRRAGAAAQAAIWPTACRPRRACTCSAGPATRCCTSAPPATCASGCARTSPRPRPATGSSTW